MRYYAKLKRRLRAWSASLDRELDMTLQALSQLIQTRSTGTERKKLDKSCTASNPSAGSRAQQRQQRKGRRQ